MIAWQAPIERLDEPFHLLKKPVVKKKFPLDC
jgi:hypothetical protein